ncbi:MAG: hypothetical protein AAGC74_01800 [Verrucomicrobiota bacterium]
MSSIHSKPLGLSRSKPKQKPAYRTVDDPMTLQLRDLIEQDLVAVDYPRVFPGTEVECAGLAKAVRDFYERENYVMPGQVTTWVSAMLERVESSSEV